MSLTERDESDLAGLASELGSPETDARARHLVQTDPEAAEVYRQLTTIDLALRAEERSAPPLSGDETDALASAILARASRTRSQRWFALRRPLRWGGLAAAIVIIAVTWFLFKQSAPTVVAEIVSIPIRASVNRHGVIETARAQVRAGQPVETHDNFAVLKLVNGGRIAVAEDTRCTIQPAGDAIDLERGSLFLEATRALQLRADDMSFRLEGPSATVVVQNTPTDTTCMVYAGRVKVIRQGAETQLSEAQMGTWNKADDGVLIGPFETTLPAWATYALQRAASP